MDLIKDGRRRLPDERPGINHRFVLGGHKAYIRVSFFEDGSLGELFFDIARAGSTLSGMADAFAIMVSKELQKGMTIREFIDKFKHVRFEPSGLTTNPEIPIASSLLDYIARWFEIKFLPAEKEREKLQLEQEQQLPIELEGVSSSTQPEEQEEPAPAVEEKPVVEPPKKNYLETDLGRWDKKTGAAQ